MLIRLVEYNWTNEDETGLENPHFVKAYKEDNFDKAISFIKEMLDRGVRVGEDWYTICDYVWNFPESSECIPSLDIYVVNGYDPI